MMKEQKGITLIALVITIIVLLILAGVSIAMLTGNNGVLTKATTAKSETAVAEVKEQVMLAMNEILMNANDTTNTTADSTDYPKTLTVEKIAAKINDNTGTKDAEKTTAEAGTGKLTYNYGADAYTVEFNMNSTTTTLVDGIKTITKNQ